MKKKLNATCCYLACCSLAVLHVQAGPLDEWEPVYTQPTPNALHDVLYTNDQWVAVGDAGTVLISTDNGDSWLRQDTGITNVFSDLHGIAYGNGLYVAVGWGGVIATSPDGMAWTVHEGAAGLYDNFNAVTYGDGLFVAVGDMVSVPNSNVVATSPDGINWTPQASVVSNPLNDVIYREGLFVAVGGEFFGPGSIMTSPDGSAWTERTPGSSVPPLGGIAYGDGYFISVGSTYSLYSPDGMAWTSVYQPGANYMWGVAFGDGVFTSVGAEPTYWLEARFYSSTNGTNWISRSGPESAAERVRYGNGRFVAVGVPIPEDDDLGFRRGTILISDDGTYWTPRSVDIPPSGGPGTATPIIDLAAVNGVYVIINTNYTRYVTTDPYQYWYTQFNDPSTALGTIAGKIVEASFYFSGSIYSTTNGTDWNYESYLPGRVNDFASLGDMVLGAGDAGYLFSSTDGSSWSNHYSNVSENLYGVDRGEGTYVAVGEDGRVVSSTDLTSWTSTVAGSGKDLNAVLHADGRFIAVGDGGTIVFSEEGTNWVSAISPTVFPLHALAYAFGQYHAFGDSGSWLTSTNGTDWVKHNPLTEYTLRAADLWDGKLVAVGGDGLFLVSSDGVHWSHHFNGWGYGGGVLWDMIQHKGRLIAASGAGFAESKAGLSWYYTGVGASYGLAAHENTIVGVGTGDAYYLPGISYSLDNGRTWGYTNFDETVGSELDGVAYGNGQFVAVGEHGWANTNSPVMTSPDGVNWTLRSSGTDLPLSDLAFGNNMFVAISYSSQVLTSSNGVDWTLIDTGVSGGYDGIEFIDNEFVAVGTSIATSSDGLSWTDKGYSGDLLIGITRAMGMYIAVGENGTILTGTDLTNWTARPSGTRQTLKAIEFFHDRFLAVGHGGTILASGYLTNSPAEIVEEPMDVALELGATNVLSVVVQGRFPISYQWYKDGVAIEGATSDTLVLSFGGELGAGVYHVVVANELETQQSASATVTENGPVILLTFLPPVPTNEYSRLLIQGPTNQYYEIQYTEQLGTNANWNSGDYIYLYGGPQESYMPSYIDYYTTNAFFRALLQLD